MTLRRKSVVLVEDDHRLQSELIRILGEQPDIECLYGVSSAEEAVERIPCEPPDVVLMDVKLPGKSGIDCIHELRKRVPGIEIVILTAYDEDDNIFRALKEGASGYLLKTSSPSEIFEAVRDVYSGGAPFSSHIARKVANYFREDKRIEDENQNLSPREKEVLRLLASGYIYKEVSDELGITVETVRTYVKRICMKLHVRSKVEAIIKYRA